MNGQRNYCASNIVDFTSENLTFVRSSLVNDVFYYFVARLILPQLNYNGTVCVNFYYHMFGFHINTLKLIQRLAVGDVTVWIRSFNMGNTWYHGAVQVPITSPSQVCIVL